MTLAVLHLQDLKNRQIYWLMNKKRRAQWALVLVDPSGLIMSPRTRVFWPHGFVICIFGFISGLVFQEVREYFQQQLELDISLQLEMERQSNTISFHKFGKLFLLSPWHLSCSSLKQSLGKRRGWSHLTEANQDPFLDVGTTLQTTFFLYKRRSGELIISMTKIPLFGFLLLFFYLISWFI